ncbi:hypothetical protein PR001_g24740 [Phytophthora rubi]|uniref:Uncharacterized protein n=1 Tax=Phytophthora rubi TaxID=129364 RepID=A0A6A3I650_9STRA|nr:hypothetical protein PR002_g25074 [Phytophthora rubi]KAE8978798.1 hypothetical protein PR001_g24740 [Phytophthora rubi]
MPTSMGELLRPALLWLPHCLVVDTNNSAVVVEVDTKSGRILRDVDHACVSDAYARVTINRLGVFAVISRRKAQRNGESSSDCSVESARLFLIRPKCLSASPPTDRVQLSLVLVRDLGNYCAEAEVQLKDKFERGDDPALEGTIDSFKLRIRENFSLNLVIGGGARVVFRWPPPSPKVMVIDTEISLANLAPPDSVTARNHPAFLSLPLRAAVCKTPAQIRTRVNTAEHKSSESLPNSDWTLFEREWRVPIPILRDAKAMFAVPPPTPSVVERTKKHLVLVLTAAAKSAVLKLKILTTGRSLFNQLGGRTTFRHTFMLWR